MSNCIDISSQTFSVFFPASKIKIETLKNQIQLHQNHRPFGEDHKVNGSRDWTDEQFICSTIYWFLNDQNVQFFADGVRINFGEARSSHTWRDFRSTIICLNKFFMQGEKYHRFVCMDTDMGDGQWESYPVTFKPEGETNA